MNYGDVNYAYLDSRVGPILIARVEAGITHILFENSKYPVKIGSGWRQHTGGLREAMDQLRAYFAGERTKFDLPLAPGGTPFQKKVWAALREIPCGETRSYGQLAARLGVPEASRAVGAANGRNPIAIVVPCHRVIGADGKLTGYAGGLNIKKMLLEHEAALMEKSGAQMSFT